MSQNVIYVGVDVDDVHYHGSALNKATGEVLEFQCRPTLKGLVGQLEKVREYFGGGKLKLCYEASYIGFSLRRDLNAGDYDCEVVAPTSIPRRGGKLVKTDRIDATELAEFYANGLLTIVVVPDANIEGDRDLLRSRQQLVQQQGALRKHIQSLLRRNGLHYKAQTQRKTHWRKHHYGWLARTVASGSDVNPLRNRRRSDMALFLKLGVVLMRNRGMTLQNSTSKNPRDSDISSRGELGISGKWWINLRT